MNLSNKSKQKTPILIDVSPIDWELLRSQKLDLQYSDASLHSQAGLLHLLDYIQDQAAKQLGDDAVFGPAE